MSVSIEELFYEPYPNLGVPPYQSDEYQKISDWMVLQASNIAEPYAIHYNDTLVVNVFYESPSSLLCYPSAYKILDFFGVSYDSVYPNWDCVNSVFLASRQNGFLDTVGNPDYRCDQIGGGLWSLISYCAYFISLSESELLALIPDYHDVNGAIGLLSQNHGFLKYIGEELV